MSTPSQVTGTDGVVPVYNPDGLWTIWALEQLYTGGVGANMYVGKVNDYVVDYTTDERWKITALDATTLVPTLTSITPVIDPGDMDLTDVLFGVGPGTQSDTYRIYIDQSTMPFKLVVDQRLYVNSVLTAYCKIFQGSQLNGTAKVISAFYDTSGNFLGENVPLELVAMPNAQNFSVKTVQPAYTKVPLQDGDLVTAVFYSADGGVVSIRQLLAMNTGFIRSTEADAKYITGISLDSPWLSTSNPNLIQYPLNVLVSGWNLFGIVNYSDGSTVKLPVDGTKFSVMGLGNYVATIVGQKTNFTLKYTLAANEIIYSANQGAPNGDRFLTEGYQAITENWDGSYTVKLFVVPSYNTTTNQYELAWWLYNLDRTIAINVTPYVVFQPNSSFQPALYGSMQSLQVQLNLNDVNGMYNKFIFTQTLQIVLYGPATNDLATPWAIYYSPSQNPPYGTNISAKTNFVNQNLMYVDISQGLTDFDTWLAAVLAPAQPLYDPMSEPSYPAPNMFMFTLSDGSTADFPISQWNAQNLIDLALTDSSTLNVQFFYRTSENDLQIAMCPMTVNQTD